MEVIGKNLKRIRLLKNLSLKEASDMFDMSATGLQKYEKGEITPNSEKIIMFANGYNVKIIDILKEEMKVEMKFNAFRKRKKLTGKKLELLKELISIEVAKTLQIIELGEINSYVKFNQQECNSLNEAEEIANNFRNEIMKISTSQPISDLISVLENLGILIIILNDDKNYFEDFDGLCEVVNNHPIIILPNQKDGARLRFTLAHELGHLLLKNDEEKYEEKYCNRFASCLLMPKEAMIRELGVTRKKIYFPELEAIKQEYKVSYTAIAYRMKDLNIISEYYYKNLHIKLNEKIGKKDPNPIQPEISYNYKKNIYKLQSKEVISISKACELLEISNDEYRKQINNY